MSHWIQAVDENKAEDFLAAMYELRLPSTLRNPNNATKHVGRYIVHQGISPNEAYAGQVRIRVETALKVHAEAEDDALDAVIQPYVDSSDVTAAELQAVRDGIIAARGGTINGDNFLPAFFEATSIDDATMESQGWNEDV